MACGAGGTGQAVPTATTPSAAIPSPGACAAPAIVPSQNPETVPEPPPPQGTIEATIAIDGAAAGIETGFGSIWIAGHRSNTVYRIDPATNKVTAAIKVEIPDVESGIGSLTVGSRYVWLPVGSQTNQLWRIDPATNNVDLKVPIDSVGSPVEVGPDLWIDIDPSNGAAKRHSEAQLDPETLRVLRSVDVGPAVPAPAYSPELDYGLGSLWAIFSNDKVARLDPASGKVLATIKLPAVPQGYGTIAFAAGHVFIAEGDKTVARIDPTTNCVDGIVYLGNNLRPASASPSEGKLGLVVAPQGLYVVFDRGALALVDPATLKVLKSVRLDEQDHINRAAYGFGSLWYSTFGNNTVLRLKPIV
jgi:YVTN family beta-propeller protein